MGVARITCRNRKGDRVLVIMVAPGMIPGFPPPVPGVSYTFSLRGRHRLSNRNDRIEGVR
jgi:hypothetical protein